MNVLVDSTIWSLAFRRKTASGPEVAAWAEIVRRGEAHIIGPVRQEVLSGIREPERFERVRQRLRAFPDLLLAREHFERAAEFFNICRTHGIQGSATDFLLCAAAEMWGLHIFTSDADFPRYARHLPIQLYQVP